MPPSLFRSCHEIPAPAKAVWYVSSPAADRGCASYRVRLIGLVVKIHGPGHLLCVRRTYVHDAHPLGVHAVKEDSRGRRVCYIPGKLALALVARDAAAEGRARLSERSGNRSRDRSRDRSSARRASEASSSPAGRQGNSDARLSRAEHEVRGRAGIAAPRSTNALYTGSVSPPGLFSFRHLFRYGVGACFSRVARISFRS